MDASPSQIKGQTDFATSSGRPWWKACCIGCLLLIVAVLVGGSLLLRVAAGPSNHLLSALPPEYPKELQPYRMSDATAIVYVDGSKRSKFVDIIMSPIRLITGVVGTTHSTESGTASSVNSALSMYSEQLQGLDSVTVSWKKLPARHEEVMAYYATLFKKAGMTVQPYRNDETNTDIVFAKRADAAMQLSVQDTSEVAGVDDIELNVEYSVKN